MKFHSFKTFFPWWVAQKNIGFKCREMGVSKQSIFFLPFFLEAKKSWRKKEERVRRKWEGCFSPKCQYVNGKLLSFSLSPYFLLSSSLCISISFALDRYIWGNHLKRTFKVTANVELSFFVAFLKNIRRRNWTNSETDVPGESVFSFPLSVCAETKVALISKKAGRKIESQGVSFYARKKRSSPDVSGKERVTVGLLTISQEKKYFSKVSLSQVVTIKYTPLHLPSNVADSCYLRHNWN